MDKTLLEFYHLAARVRITGHFEPAGPWDHTEGYVWDTRKVVTYRLVDHFVGDPVGWFYEDYSNTSCETGFEPGEEWLIATIADDTGGDHAGLCTGAVFLRSSSGKLMDRNFASRSLYSAFLEACGGTLPLK